MKPLIVLLTAFVLALLGIRFFSHTWNTPLAGRIAMSVMLLFTSIAHFAFTRGMSMMMPAFIPYKTTIVWLTGVFEIITAVTLLVPAMRATTAMLLIFFFVIMLPANINAAVKKVDYQTGNYQGNGIGYLWFRIPLQLFFMFWIYWFALR